MGCCHSTAPELAMSGASGCPTPLPWGVIPSGTGQAAAVRKKGELTWHQKAPSRTPWFTLTLPPPVLTAPSFPWPFPDVGTIYLSWGKGTMWQGSDAYYLMMTSSPAPASGTTEGVQAPFPLFLLIASHLRCAFLKSPINSYVGGRGLHQFLLGTYLPGNMYQAFLCSRLQ